jgi:hypothetical protein
MQAMEDIVSRLLKGMCFDWTGPSYQERMASTQMGMLYTFSIFVIFLFPAYLYESWTVPFSFMLALPLGAISGVLASSFRGLPNDFYFQMGLLTTLGLTTKNATLIVQFAKGKLEKGMGLIEVTLEGARLRLRRIIMTSLAFGFGLLPLLAGNVPPDADFEKRLGTSDRSRERMDWRFGSGNLGNLSPSELDNFVRGPSHEIHIVRYQNVSEGRAGKQVDYSFGGFFIKTVGRFVQDKQFRFHSQNSSQ